MKAILATTYFGPVQWYQKLNRFGSVLIEQHEHFLKQTFRNRCIIATTQGVQALTVPVEKPPPTSPRRGSSRMFVSAITASGARNIGMRCRVPMASPFFEYYEDDIRPFFEDRWEYLFDFNMAITEKMCELLDIHPHITLTESYQNSLPFGEGRGGALDFRTIIHPKHPQPDPDFNPKPYYQVYQERFGFLPNLSILDLLFNMGNEAVLYL